MHRKQTRRHEFPDKRRAERAYTHSIRDLVREARLEERLNLDRKQSKAFNRNWEAVIMRKEDSRYRENAAVLAAVLVDAI